MLCISPFGQSQNGMRPLWSVGGVKRLLHLPRLSLPGCGQCFSKLHVQLHIKLYVAAKNQCGSQKVIALGLGCLFLVVVSA
jgi:hypothetical protein